MNPYYYGYYPPVYLPRREQTSTRQPYVLDSSWAEKYPGQVFSSGPKTVALAALTFDDAPDGLFAPLILDILAHYDVKATFFCLGRCVHQQPDMVKRMAQEGHVLANHTYDHLDITKLSPDKIREQLERTEVEIEDLTGLRTALFRPPYGFLSDDSIKVVLSMGYKIIMWDLDSLDWVGQTGPAITARVVANATPGMVVLMHNACDGSVEAGTGTSQSLPYIIETLRAEGYTFTTAATMFDIPAYQ